MTAVDLSTANPTAALLQHLRGDAALVAEFGGADRMSGLNEAPYPRLRVRPSPGGSDRDLRWLLEPEVSVEVYGELDGTPGQTELRRLLYVALATVRDLPNRAPLPGGPVISGVRSTTAARLDAEPLTDQPVWRSTLVILLHP